MHVCKNIVHVLHLSEQVFNVRCVVWYCERRQDKVMTQRREPQCRKVKGLACQSNIVHPDSVNTRPVHLLDALNVRACLPACMPVSQTEAVRSIPFHIVMETLRLCMKPL